MSEATSRRALLAAVLAGFALGVLFAVGGGELGLPGSGAPLAGAANEGADAADEESSAAAADGVLPAAQPGPLAARRTAVVDAVARTAPAVVSITCEVATQSPFQLFYGSSGTSTTQGSGAVIRADGVVLTNAHVLDGALQITATLSDGSAYQATVVGLDGDLDLAVLQLEGAQGLPTVPLGRSHDLLLGEPVIAIGNPFGLGHTVTTGVVSSAGRRLEVAERVYQDYIQTDAGINPGNSGGPLLNIHGELIGINTAIRRDAENIGFAIPVDRAAKVARDLLRYGSVRAPWLGIAVSDIGGPRYAGTPIEQGAVAVESVRPRPPADPSPLQVGDILLRLDGQSIHSRADLNLRLASHQAGDQVSLSGLRQGQPFQAQVTAESCPADLGPSLLAQTLGVELIPLDRATARAHGLRTAQGLMAAAVSPRGSFAKAGLRVGDVIQAVHGSPVNTEEQLRTALLRAKIAHRLAVLLTVQRGPYRGHVEVAL